MNFAFSLSSRLVRAVLAWAALPFDVYFTSRDLTSSPFLLNPSASKTGSSPSTHIIHRQPLQQTHQHLQQCCVVSHPAEYSSLLLILLLKELMLLVLSMMLPQVFQVYQVPTLEVKHL